MQNSKKKLWYFAILLGMVLALVPTPVYATNKKDKKTDPEDLKKKG